MVVISKLFFDDRIGPNIKCNYVIHEGIDSCLKGAIGISKIVLIGVFKFYLNIYLVKALVEFKKINRNYPKRVVREYLRSVLYAFVFASLVFETNCLLVNLTGKFHYYNIGLLSGIISGLSIFVESTKNRELNTLIFFNLLIEAIIKNASYHKIVNFTKTKQIITFMLISSGLMHLLAHGHGRRVFPSFWFFTPPKIQKFPKASCNHDQKNTEVACLKYGSDGFVKYFVVGYAANLIKVLLSTMNRVAKNPRKLYTLLLKQSNLKFGLFLGSYVGIFRLLSCILFKLNKGGSSMNSAIAGFLAGGAFVIQPSINVLAISLTTLLQISYSVVKEATKEIRHLPLTEMLFMLCNGFLLHNRIFSVETCPRYYVTMTNIASNQLLPSIYRNLVSTFFSG